MGVESATSKQTKQIIITRNGKQSSELDQS